MCTYSAKRTNPMLQVKESEVFQHSNSLMQGAHNGILGYKATNEEQVET